MKIIIDAMGGDNAPVVPVEASVMAVSKHDIEIVLVGKNEVIKRELSKYEYPKDRIYVVNAEDVISNRDEPVKSVKTRKESSIVVAANLLKEEKGDALISMGSTGALLAVGLLIIGRMKGISRPALAALLPTKKGKPVMLMDAGANTSCRPDNLLQFAVMGDIYMRYVLEVDSPRIGLVSNGEEEGKGNELTKDAYVLMKQEFANFAGNIEGRDINMGDIDVAVCDGFVGNVILKTVEGMGLVVSSSLKELFMTNLRTKLAGLLVKDNLLGFKKMMDYSEYGGAPLLGTKMPIIKGHGSSKTKAAYNTIIQAKRFIDANINEHIQNSISKESKNG